MKITLRVCLILALFLIFGSRILTAYTIGPVTVETPHFVIEYEDDQFDLSGNPLQDYADPVFIFNLKAATEEVWSFMKGKGFKNPPNIPDQPGNNR